MLVAYTDNDVTISIEENEEMKFERKDIALIRLAFDF